jgi:hypothetical protein
MLTITAYIEQTEPWSLGERGVASVRFKLAKQHYLKDMKEEHIMRRSILFRNHSNP